MHNELQRQTGPSYVMLRNLYSDKSERVDFKTLDRICGALDVGVGDILEYMPER